MVQLPGSLDANKKEKQHTEGCCFACIKQGHLRHSGHVVRKETMSKGVQGVPKVHVTQVEQEQGLNPLLLPNVDNLPTKLRGISINRKDKFLKAFLNQRGFLKSLKQAVMLNTYRQSDMVYI